MVYRDPSKDLYSEEEAAALLGMTKRMLAKRRYEGKIGHCKDGHFVGYSQKHIDTYCDKFDKERGLNRQSASPSSRPKKEREPWAQRKLRYRKVSAAQCEKDQKSRERLGQKRKSLSALFIAMVTGVPAVLPRTRLAPDASTGEQALDSPKPRSER